jgi:hypothetical protein
MKAMMVVLLLNGNQLLRSQTSAAKLPLLPAGSQPDERYIIERLQSAVSSTQYAVRIYFHGACGAGDTINLQFPKVDVLPPETNQKGVQAIREMFRNDENVTISVDPSNVVRIIIGNVSRSLLDTKLSSVKLTTAAQFNPGGPGGAIDLLIASKSIQEAMRKHQFHQEPSFYIGLEQPPSRKGHRLPVTISDLSLDQALDTIAKTFPGVVMYGECDDTTKGHTIDIKFDWYQQQ